MIIGSESRIESKLSDVFESRLTKIQKVKLHKWHGQTGTEAAVGARAAAEQVARIPQRISRVA